MYFLPPVADGAAPFSLGSRQSHQKCVFIDQTINTMEIWAKPLAKSMLASGTTPYNRALPGRERGHKTLTAAAAACRVAADKLPMQLLLASLVLLHAAITICVVPMVVVLTYCLVFRLLVLQTISSFLPVCLVAASAAAAFNLSESGWVVSFSARWSNIYIHTQYRILTFS